jgi:hypothetical protein
MLPTEKQGQMNSMAMSEVNILDSLNFHKAHHYAA